MMESAEEFKGKKGFTRLWNALGYSRDGIAAAWTNEAAFREEVLLALITIPLAIFLGKTGVEPQRTAEQAHHGGLARAVGTNQAVDLTGSDAQAHADHGPGRTEGFVQVECVNQLHCHDRTFIVKQVEIDRGFGG